ncbi:hypothetical protein QJQ45_010281 [Haematococcus lacustris]|nr:hypothetical protein QJQ45_010281 [Haematococcus lacustris]
MTSVDRAGYMDSQMSSIITEQIQKERKIQRNYFEEQEAAGLIIPKPPTPPVPTKTVLETVGLPQHVRTLHADPIQTMNTTISSECSQGIQA